MVIEGRSWGWSPTAPGAPLGQSNSTLGPAGAAAHRDSESVSKAAFMADVFLSGSFGPTQPGLAGSPRAALARPRGGLVPLRNRGIIVLWDERQWSGRNKGGDLASTG